MDDWSSSDPSVSAAVARRSLARETSSDRAEYRAPVATTGTANRRTTSAKVVPHLTVAERVARGKAARAEVPRSSHAVYEPPPRRSDPIKLLAKQIAAKRLTPGRGDARLPASRGRLRQRRTQPS